MDLMGAYKLGTQSAKVIGGEVDNIKYLAVKMGEQMPKDNPMCAFMLLTAYFSGKQESVMEGRMKEYEEKHNAYKETLDMSKEAHEGKAVIGKNKKTKKYSPYSDGFKTYMDRITKDRFSDEMQKGNDTLHSKDEWGQMIDIINQQKDMDSTELNKLSTQMDAAVKDSSEAQQMCANAVKKVSDLMATLGKGSGG